MQNHQLSGYDAYKVVLRNATTNVRYSLYTESWPRPPFAEEKVWCYRYPVGVDIEQPNMFVYQTYEQAIDEYRIYTLLCPEPPPGLSGVPEIWRVLVYEETLSEPTKVLPHMDAIWHYGSQFWRVWNDPDQLQWADSHIVKLAYPPEGTRICQKMRMVEQLPMVW